MSDINNITDAKFIVIQKLVASDDVHFYRWCDQETVENKGGNFERIDAMLFAQKRMRQLVKEGRGVFRLARSDDATRHTLIDTRHNI